MWVLKEVKTIKEKVSNGFKRRINKIEK